MPRFDNQKKVKAYEIFISKKHEAYIRLYEVLGESADTIKGILVLDGFNYYLIKNLPYGKLRDTLKRLNFFDCEVQSIRETFEPDESKAEDKVNYMYLMRQARLCNLSLYKAKIVIKRSRFYIPWERGGTRLTN